MQIDGNMKASICKLRLSGRQSYPNVSLAKSTAKDSPPAAKLRADTLNLPRLALIGAIGRALVNAAGALCTQFFMVNAILRRQARQVGYQF